MLSTIAMILLSGFLLYVVDIMTKVQADVRLVAAYVQHQQQRRSEAKRDAIESSYPAAPMKNGLGWAPRAP